MKIAAGEPQTLDAWKDHRATGNSSRTIQSGGSSGARGVARPDEDDARADEIDRSVDRIVAASDPVHDMPKRLGVIAGEGSVRHTNVGAPIDEGDALGSTERQASNEFPDETTGEGAWAGRHASSDGGQPSTRTCDPARSRKIERGSIGARAGMSEALDCEIREGGAGKKAHASTDIRIVPPEIVASPSNGDDASDGNSEKTNDRVVASSDHRARLVPHCRRLNSHGE